MLFSSLLFLT